MSTTGCGPALLPHGLGPDEQALHAVADRLLAELPHGLDADREACARLVQGFRWGWGLRPLAPFERWVQKVVDFYEEVFAAPRATDFNAVVSDISALLVDLRAASAPADCRLTEERRGRTVVIDHLEARLNNRAVATRLMERGLVLRGPAFDLFDPSFRQFVLRAEAPRDVLDWEQEESGHGWARIQIPFLVAMVVIVGFFFLTQPQMYSVAIALLGALTTAVPLVLQLIGFFERQRTASGGG